MNKMHNLSKVIKFELKRTLKKPSFWLIALSFPIIMAAVFGVIFWSNQATSEAAKKLQDQKYSVMITDDSGLIKPEFLAAMNIKSTTKDAGINEVKAGKVDAYFYFPKDISKQKIELFGKDVGMFENSRYSAVANLLLAQSVEAQISASQLAILQNTLQLQTTTYRDGQEYDGIKQLIAPAIFLVLFYLLIAFFGNQMLTSTIEEKENRTIEMLLTTVQPRALITGKIISLVLLALIQSVVILAPIVVMYFMVGSQLSLPNFDLTNIPFDPARVGLAALIFVTSFMLFTGLLVTIGSMMPTAKEASSWFGIVMIAIFGPLYGVTAFISYPDSPFVQFLSLFPLTSPIPLMLRNAVGNLPLWEALLGVVILAVSATIVMLLAVRVFRYGAMQYDSKLSLKALRAKRSQ